MVLVSIFDYIRLRAVPFYSILMGFQLSLPSSFPAVWLLGFDGSLVLLLLGYLLCVLGLLCDYEGLQR